MARKKRSEQPKENVDPISRFVFKMHDGPTPPDRVAAEEKFWKLFVARVIATDISDIDDVDASA